MLSSHSGKARAISPEPPVFGPAMDSGSIATAPSAAADRSILSAILATKVTERLFLPREPLSPAARRRFGIALVLVLLLHAGALYALLHRFAFLPETPQEQEIPVEVVMVPPPPPPPAPKQPDLPNPQDKPPPPKDLKPGTEIPRTANNETIERKAPDDVSKAPQVAPSVGQSPQAPQADKAASAPTPAKAQAKAAPPAPTSPAPDAEPLASATAKQDTTEQNDAEAQARAQEVESKRMAALLAGMEPLPDFKIGAAARPTPVSGGKGANTYLNILYGMIMPHMHVPQRVSSSPPPSPVVVSFEIDGRGRLVSQSVVRSSGSSELDMAALFAVREGAPFPAPPGGVPIGLTFTY
jgi:TonB family protein